MSERLTLGLERVLVSLDVPLIAAEELAEVRGERVWWQLVRNERARCAVAASLRLARGDEEGSVASAWALMESLRNEVPGVRETIASSPSTPGVILRWMIQNLVLSSDVQWRIVTGERNKAIVWYLAHEERLGPRAAAEARRRSRFGGGSRHEYKIRTPLWDTCARTIEVGVATREAGEGVITDSLMVGNLDYLDYLAQKGRDALGSGDSEESRRAWRQLFDIAEAGGSDNVERLIDAVRLVTGGVA